MSAQPAADALLDEVAACERDPLRYVRFAFPWSEPDGPLAAHAGPQPWQAGVLDYIGEQLRAGRSPVRVAVASGHGVGKSALVAMITDWAMSTMPNTRGVITANTEVQLRTKTWPELVTWRRRSITHDWFKLGETTLESVDPESRGTWRIDRVPWTATNSEAFAGLHNQGRRILVVFDEASAIDDVIWEVTEGALTDVDTQIVWLAFGNPTRASGRFRDAFGLHSAAWHTVRVDSRHSTFTNKAQIQQWVELYGEDSDFVRVRVRGESPNQSVTQLIPSDIVAAARRQSTTPTLYTLGDPLIAGLDVARSGQAESVLAFRKGRDARSFTWHFWRDPDSMRLASNVVKIIRDMSTVGLVVRHLCVDGGGIGGPVCDRIRQIGLPPGCVLHEVNFGSRLKADRDYRDRAIQMWDRMRDRLTRGMAIPDDPTLAQQLVTRERYWTDDNRAYLESKIDMVDRGIESPDRADALALTEAEAWAADDEVRVHRRAQPKVYRPLRIRA